MRNRHAQLDYWAYLFNLCRAIVLDHFIKFCVPSAVGEHLRTSGGGARQAVIRRVIREGSAGMRPVVP